ncbi:uncharacterized protein LOC119596790 [Penaeus monodon]|uniref:uncharacterized protein LOC119596790 n=1 Tax=Penaeus monodon TaxID=6687 RepID=UPI0018A710CE|nr:uncharacterized protein LOC119596790 [Penaeus monodon]
MPEVCLPSVFVEYTESQNGPHPTYQYSSTAESTERDGRGALSGPCHCKASALSLSYATSKKPKGSMYGYHVAKGLHGLTPSHLPYKTVTRGVCNICTITKPHTCAPKASPPWAQTQIQQYSDIVPPSKCGRSMQQVVHTSGTATTLPPLCHHSASTTPEYTSGTATTLPPLCYHSATTTPEYTSGTATTLPPLCHHSATTTPEYTSGTATTLPPLCHHSASTTPEHTSGTATNGPLP